MTLAPPPATIVQIRPLGFKTVNFRDALVFNANNKQQIFSKILRNTVAPSKPRANKCY